MTTTQAASKAPQKPSHPSILRTLVFTVLHITVLMALAYLCLLSYAVFLSITHSGEYAAADLQHLLNTLLTVQHGVISENSINHCLIDSPFAKAVISLLHHISSRTAVLTLLNGQWLLPLPYAITLQVAAIIAMRAHYLMALLPLFILMLLLSLTDGLAQRDIRRFQGARESTFIFHRAKLLMPLCFYLPIFLYFVSPLIIEPLWFLSPMLLTIGLLTYLCVKHFKKYL